MSFSVVSLLHCSAAESAARAQDLAASLARLLPHAHAESSRLNALRACALHGVDLASARMAAETACAEAQEAGDDPSIAWALLADCVAPSLESSPGRRLTNCQEALRIAQNCGERELISGAYFLLLAELAESGAVTELDRVLNPNGALLTAAPWLEDEEATGWFRCLRAVLEGQVSRAEIIIGAGQSAANSIGAHGKRSLLLGQLAIIRWMQGRTSEMEALVLRGRQNASNETIWTVLLAWVWVLQGRRIAAGALLETIPPVDELVRDRDRLATLSLLALTSVELGDRDTAAALRVTLLPFRDRLITMGFGMICLGTVHRPIARLSQMLGDHEDAIGHYRAAVALTARLGAHPWLAEAQIDLAGLLMQCGDPTSAEEAEDLAAEALATARALRLSRLEELAASLLASARRRREHAVLRANFPDIRPTIRVLGTFEVTSIRGEPVRWQSKKARKLLKILMARRGATVTRERLIDLLWPDEPFDRLYNRLAVATSTIRRAFDPAAEFPPNTFVESRGDLLRLNTRLIEIDAECFMSDVRTALERTLDTTVRIGMLTTALDSYTGDALIDEPDAPWALHYRREVHDTFLEAAFALGLAASEIGDHLTRVDAYRRVLAFDVYEQRAHEGLIHALTALGAHGQAAEAEADYVQRMQDLGVDVGHARFSFAEE